MRFIPGQKVKENRKERSIGDTRFKLATLGAMCITLFMTNLDDTVMNVALPKMQLSLEANVSDLQWILNSYTLTAASLMLPSGTLGDVYGRKRVFLIGLLIFSIASLICGYAPNLSVLITGRLLQGMGAAALIPTSLAIVTEAFPEAAERTKAIGVWAAVSGLALVIGPVFGGILVDTLGWQSVFFLNAPLGATALWMSSHFVQPDRHRIQQRIDLPGIVLSISVLSTLTYVFTEDNEQSLWLSVIGILSLLAFLWVESRSRHPMLPLNLFQQPAFTAVNLVNSFVFFTFLGLIFIFSLFLQQIQGHSAIAAGLRFLPMNAAFVGALLVSGWLASRLGCRLTIAAGLLLASVATSSFVHLQADSHYSAMWIGLVLSGFGGGVTLAPLTTVALNAVLPTQAGITSALLNITTRLGGVLGIALQGRILAHELTSALERSLNAWNLPPSLHAQIVTNVLQGDMTSPTSLPAAIAPQVMQAMREAFVTGLHQVVMFASLILLAGAIVIWVSVPSTVEPRSLR